MTRRHKLFLLLAAAALLVIGARHAYLAGPGGEDLRREAARISRREGELSAIRGRLLTPDGQVAAWSERCYDLIWMASPADLRRVEEIRAALLQAFFPAGAPERLPAPGTPVKYELTARELEIADALAQEFPELDIELRWERRHGENAPGVGAVRQVHGMERGVSGAELRYDAILRGTPGRYTVMLDRRGRWIDSTFQILTPSRPGKDVTLDLADLAEEDE